MTRLVRLLLPLSLSALSTGAIVAACHRGDVPAAPRPEPTDPSGKPITTIGPTTETPADAGVDSLLGAPPAGAAVQLSPHAARGFAGGAEGAALLASQPVTPAPSGAPAPGAPSPSPSPSPSPAQPAPSPAQPAPGQPPTGSPQPGAPAQPGVPTPSPSSPSSPAPGTPRPGPGSGSGPGPGPSAGPSDAGVFDAGLPQLPPVSDAGFPGDAGMQPILRRK